MHHRSLRCCSVFLLLSAAGCGGGDFVSKRVGKGGLDSGKEASTGAVSGMGGEQSTGAGGRSSSTGGSSSGGSTSSGGTAATGGRQGNNTADASAGGADGGDDGATGGTAGTNGGGGTGTAGTGGAAATGGAENGGASGCTNPTMWYLDDDQDGYGSKAIPAMSSCVPPPGHYTKVGGDCDDSNDAVHPQLTAPEIQYFDKPYQTPGGIDSFDYDCSGYEEGDPGQAKAATSCPGLSLGTCGGSGYRTVSTGNRVAANAYCGSKSYRTCVNTAAALCTAQDVTNFSEAYRCK
jgi:hypothetical protein